MIALSALMTTTMQEMKNVIHVAKQMNCHARILIGGAVVTQDYADEIGADGYADDAADEDAGIPAEVAAGVASA